MPRAAGAPWAAQPDAAGRHLGGRPARRLGEPALHHRAEVSLSGRIECKSSTTGRFGEDGPVLSAFAVDPGLLALADGRRRAGPAESSGVTGTCRHHAVNRSRVPSQENRRATSPKESPVTRNGTAGVIALAPEVSLKPGARLQTAYSADSPMAARQK